MRTEQKQKVWPEVWPEQKGCEAAPSNLLKLLEATAGIEPA